MSDMASQITGVSIVCPTADQTKHQSSALLALCEGNPPVTGGFPSQRVSNAENVSFWWRHRGANLLDNFNAMEDTMNKYVPMCKFLITFAQRPEHILLHDDVIKFSALLAICVGISPVPGEFPVQRAVTRSFDVFFDLHLNKRLSKQSQGWWFETLLRPLWRHSNGAATVSTTCTMRQISTEMIK